MNPDVYIIHLIKELNHSQRRSVSHLFFRLHLFESSLSMVKQRVNKHACEKAFTVNPIRTVSKNKIASSWLAL